MIFFFVTISFTILGCSSKLINCSSLYMSFIGDHSIIDNSIVRQSVLFYSTMLSTTSPKCPVTLTVPQKIINSSSGGNGHFVIRIEDFCTIEKSLIHRECWLKGRVNVSESVLLNTSTISEFTRVNKSIICSDNSLGGSCECSGSVVGPFLGAHHSR